MYERVLNYSSKLGKRRKCVEVISGACRVYSEANRSTLQYSTVLAEFVSHLA